MEVAVTAAAIVFIVAVLSSCVTQREHTWTDADWGKLTQELKHING